MIYSLTSIIERLRKLFGIPEAKSRSEYVLVHTMLVVYAAIIGAFIFSVIAREWLGVFVSAVAFLVIWTTRFFARRHHFQMPIVFEFTLILFLYASLIMGEVHGYYTRFWWWDIVLHIGSGVALGFVGFLILYALYRRGKLDASPFLIVVFSFSFALALGTSWEIFEYTVDQVFGVNMQKSGLRDTMWDLIVNAVGAFMAAVAGYFYLQHDTRGVGVFRYYLKSVFQDTGRG